MIELNKIYREIVIQNSIKYGVTNIAIIQVKSPVFGRESMNKKIKQSVNDKRRRI